MPKIVAKKEDWVLLGYQLFSQKGEAGIVVEQMADQLKVNKSSFYWHFKTKKEFIHALVEYWIKTETGGVIEQTQQAKTVQEKLDQFLTIAFKNDPYLEFIFFLKRYAVKDKEMQQIIDEVDAQRLAFCSQLFQEMGYNKQEAEVKSTIFYNYLIGYHEMIKNKKQAKDYLVQVKDELKHFLNI